MLPEMLMTTLTRTFSLAFLFLAAAAGLCAQDTKMLESAWYPLEVGTAWTYKTSDMTTFTVKVTKHEKVGNVLCARLEMSGEGRVSAFEHIAVASDGIYRHGINGKTPDKPVLILKLPPKKGDSWMVDCKVDGDPLKGTFKVDDAEVTVPAGKFKGVAVSSDDLDANGLKVNCTFYYAEGKGIVKQVIEIGGKKTTIELEKFEPGKK
jgi:hypothetical protein